MKEESTVSKKAMLTDAAKLKSLSLMVASKKTQDQAHTADFDFFDTIEPVKKNQKGSGLSGKGDP